MTTDHRATRTTRGTPRLADLPFIGRDAERGRVDRLLHCAGAGTAAFVVVSGEHGVGKTRLIQQIALDAAASGWTSALGTAYEVERDRPYAIVADALGLSILDTTHLTVEQALEEFIHFIRAHSPA